MKAKKAIQATALGWVVVTQYGRQGEEIARVRVPSTVDALAPLMSVGAGPVHAVVLENELVAPHATCSMRVGWVPPLLSPCWWRYQDRDVELVEEWARMEAEELARDADAADARAVAEVEALLEEDRRVTADLLAQVVQSKVTRKKGRSIMTP